MTSLEVPSPMTIIMEVKASPRVICVEAQNHLVHKFPNILIPLITIIVFMETGTSTQTDFLGIRK